MKGKEKKLMIKVIKESVALSLQGKITFPQIVGMLLENGIESYHVDLVRNENRYYARNGETHIEPLDFPHGKASQDFDGKSVEASIKKVQAGNSNYRQFVDEILKAGCVYYIAYLDGKRVSYFGRNGDCHVEHFPKK